MRGREGRKDGKMEGRFQGNFSTPSLEKCCTGLKEVSLIRREDRKVIIMSSEGGCCEEREIGRRVTTSQYLCDRCRHLIR